VPAVHYALGSDWTPVPWEHSVLRRDLNLFRDRIWYCLYDMFCSIYLLLSIEYLNTNFCTAVCVLWSFEVGYLAVCVLKTIFHCGRGLFCRSSGGSVGSLCLLIVSCVCLFWCWELLMVRWCFFGPYLILWLDNWRRQVNVAPWYTCFYLLFELPLLNFRFHMSQITW
jgi:hypothetical protein